MRHTAAAMLLLGAACRQAPSEPDRPAAPSAEVHAVAPVVWDTPAAWTALPPAKAGTTKASYRVPKVGDDKADAEVTVTFYGTGNLGDPERVFKEWLGQFEGDVAGTTKRESGKGKLDYEIV